MSTKKNPDTVKRYIPHQKSEDMELMNFLTMFASFGGVFMRNLSLLWLGVFLLLSVFCRKKHSTSVFQYLATIVMLGFGMVTVYLTQLKDLSNSQP